MNAHPSGRAGAHEEGDPREDPAAFRRCLAQFGTGVTVVTARAGQELVGMTANSFSSVSLEPPLVLWSIKRTSQSFPAFQRTTHFAVNVLSSQQVALSKHFGRSGSDKFDGVVHRLGVGGAPVLEGAIASFECRRHCDFDGGDHVIMVGHVERYTRSDGEALLFAQGRYGTAAEHPDMTGAAIHASPPPAGPMHEFLTALMYRAHGALSGALDAGRKAEGLTVLQSRLMAAIETLPGSTLETLLPELFLGFNAAENTVMELIAMGVVSAGPNGELALTPAGQARSRALLDRARAIEKHELAGIPLQDIAACRRVLEALVGRHRSAREQAAASGAPQDMADGPGPRGTGGKG
jgi:flavin reductase (DIM6/NTAB) family NADH-FMN oxidoreductase RutF